MQKCRVVKQHGIFAFKKFLNIESTVLSIPVNQHFYNSYFLIRARYFQLVIAVA